MHRTHRTTPHSTDHHRKVPHMQCRIALHSADHHRTVPHSAAQHCTAPHRQDRIMEQEKQWDGKWSRPQSDKTWSRRPTDLRAEWPGTPPTCLQPFIDLLPYPVTLFDGYHQSDTFINLIYPLFIIYFIMESSDDLRHHRSIYQSCIWPAY